MASACCLHPGISTFWHTFVSHHTLGKIAILQLRFMESCIVPIRIPRYVQQYTCCFHSESNFRSWLRSVLYLLSCLKAMHWHWGRSELLVQ